MARKKSRTSRGSKRVNLSKRRNRVGRKGRGTRKRTRSGRKSRSGRIMRRTGRKNKTMNYKGGREMSVMELNRGILNQKSQEYNAFVALINNQNYRHKNPGNIQFYNHMGNITYQVHNFSILPNFTFKIDEEQYYLAIEDNRNLTGSNLIGYVKINDTELKQ